LIERIDALLERGVRFLPIFSMRLVHVFFIQIATRAEMYLILSVFHKLVHKLKLDGLVPDRLRLIARECRRISFHLRSIEGAVGAKQLRKLRGLNLEWIARFATGLSRDHFHEDWYRRLRCGRY